MKTVPALVLAATCLYGCDAPVQSIPRPIPDSQYSSFEQAKEQEMMKGARYCAANEDETAVAIDENGKVYDVRYSSVRDDTGSIRTTLVMDELITLISFSRRVALHHCHPPENVVMPSRSDLHNAIYLHLERDVINPFCTLEFYISDLHEGKPRTLEYALTKELKKRIQVIGNERLIQRTNTPHMEELDHLCTRVTILYYTSFSMLGPAAGWSKDQKYRNFEPLGFHVVELGTGEK